MSDPYTETYSGNQLYFLNPTVDMVELDDISNGLSKICRYSGGITEFYSVAEHSVLLARKVWELTEDIEQTMTALYHDAAESFAMDLPRPIKKCCPDYMEIEDKLTKVIFSKFNIQPMTELVHYLDTHIVRDEAMVLFNKPPKWVEEFDSLGIKVECWDHKTAKQKWLDTYNWLLFLKEAA